MDQMLICLGRCEEGNPQFCGLTWTFPTTQGRNSENPSWTTTLTYFTRLTFLGTSLWDFQNLEIISSSWFVVGILSKNGHFCDLQHRFKVSIVSQVFMDNTFKLQGIPQSILTYHDPTFNRNFWQELFRI